jgi:hypothetical protein
LLALLLFRINGIRHSAKALAVHPITVGFLLALLLFRINRIWHSAKALAIHPMAVGVLLAFLLRVGGGYLLMVNAIHVDGHSIANTVA